MQSNNLENLYTSINNLERAIRRVEVSLEQQNLSENQLMQRINSYKEICGTQRKLWVKLEQACKTNQLEEITRSVQKINALSAMILEDIKTVIQVLNGQILQEVAGISH